MFGQNTFLRYTIYMIATLSGKIIYKSPELRKDSYFIIDVGGVGYKVFIPSSNHKHVAEGQDVTVYTYMSVSEYSLDLYGFLDPADKTFFTLLLDVPGVGPKSALNILGKTTMAEVQQAILDENPKILTDMAGLGEKTADKIIITLKNKVESLSARPKDAKGQAVKDADAEAFDALVGFGYTAAEAKKALNQVEAKVTDVGQRIRQALKVLGKR